MEFENTVIETRFGDFSQTPVKEKNKFIWSCPSENRSKNCPLFVPRRKGKRSKILSIRLLER